MSGRAPGEKPRDGVEVPLVLGAVGEVGLEVAGRAGTGSSEAVDRERERVGIVHEGRVRPVSLVDVEVDDEHGAHPAGEPERLGGHDDVVEDAETTATVGERVVRAAADVRRHAVRERKVRRHQRGTDGAARPLHELRRPGEPEREHLLRVSSPAATRRRYSRPWASPSSASVAARASATSIAGDASAPSRTSLYFPSGNRCPSGSGYVKTSCANAFTSARLDSPRRERPLRRKDRARPRVANRRSIAWAIAQRLAEGGASLAFTYQGERIEKNVRELAEGVSSPLITECDVRSDDDLERVFGEVGEAFGGKLDLLVHSVAFADARDLEAASPTRRASALARARRLRLLARRLLAARRAAHGGPAAARS